MGDRYKDGHCRWETGTTMATVDETCKKMNHCRREMGTKITTVDYGWVQSLAL